MYAIASTEPLDIIRANECEASPGLATSRFQALWNEIERLHRIEIAALTYFVSYCRDEAEELECCISPEQHKAAKELRDALGDKGSAS